MKPSRFVLFVCVILAGCSRPTGNAPKGSGPTPQESAAATLTEARKGFKTNLARRESSGTPVANPPAGVFNTVHYESPAGKLAAYLSPDPKDGKKHPAIIWITGGDCNTIDAGCWREGPAKNDQSASAYRKAGIIMMFPSLRGGNKNPGVREGFLGEIDDVIAAADFLAKQPYVDSNRIYLGGHSTGGTVVLLAAECSDRFRAVFSFGPVDDPAGYPQEYTPFRTTDRQEVDLRSPGKWITSIKSPTFVFEGANGNIDSLRTMARASTNPKARFIEVRAADHFSLLAPINRHVAQKILADTGAECNLALSDVEINGLFK